MRAIDTLVAMGVLVMASVLIGVLYVTYGSKSIANFLPEGYVILQAESKESPTEDVLILTIKNEFPDDIAVTGVSVETEGGLTPPINPAVSSSSPLTVPGRSYVTLVIGGDRRYWVVGKQYMVTVTYQVGGQLGGALIVSTVFVHG